MERVCFQLQLKPERAEEYVERHTGVWPDMLQALEATGWHNYSIFLRPETGLLIGYFETESMAATLAAMEATEVNSRWQTEMADFFADLAGRPDQGFVRLTEIFNLDQQLAGLNP